jgi:hypothetical protein
MNNFDRLHTIVPFAVMFYLLTVLMQLHAAQAFGPGSATAWRTQHSIALLQSLTHLEDEIVKAAKSDSAAVLTKDPANYTLGSFVPP